MELKTRTDLAVHNEVKKHHASWCNTLAGNVVVAGVIAPITASLLRHDTNAFTLFFAVLYMFGAFILHIVGYTFLQEIKSDADIRPSE